MDESKPTIGETADLEIREARARQFLEKIEAVGCDLTAVFQELNALRAEAQQALAAILMAKQMKQATPIDLSCANIIPSYEALLKDSKKGGIHFLNILRRLDSDPQNTNARGGKSIGKFVTLSEQAVLFIDQAMTTYQAQFENSPEHLRPSRRELVVLGLFFDNQHRFLTAEECAEITGYSTSTISSVLSEVRTILKNSGHTIVSRRNQGLQLVAVPR